MSTDETREAVEAAAKLAADRAIDAVEERKGLRFNGLFTPEVNEIAMAVLTAAATLIEAAARADERQRIAREIFAYRERRVSRHPARQRALWQAARIACDDTARMLRGTAAPARGDETGEA